MTDVTHNSRIQSTIIHLLNHYSFDSDQRPMSLVLADWIGCYPLQWILDAIVEALYQGRYKTISVEQILIIWQRRGFPLHHFNGEFKRIVCGPLMDIASDMSSEVNHTTAASKHCQALPRQHLEMESTSRERDRNVLEHEMSKKLSQADERFLEDGIDHDCMGQDGRLSELLGVGIMMNGESSQSSAPHHLLVDVIDHSMPLKQRDAEGHKIPVPVFEPLSKAHSQTLEWQQLTGATIRHHPIHQFTPIKASPAMYNKLKAIAHNHNRPLPLNEAELALMRKGDCSTN